MASLKARWIWLLAVGVFCMLCCNVAHAQRQRDWAGEMLRLLEAGQPQRALALGEQALKSLRDSRPSDRQPLLEVYIVRANALAALGDARGEATSLDQATRLAQRLFSLDDPASYDLIGALFRRAGDRFFLLDAPVAIGHFESLARLAKAADKPDEELSDELIMLGVLYQNADRLTEAAQTLERGWAAIQRAGNTDVESIVPVLRALAETYDRLGQISTALPFATRLVEILELRFQTQRPEDVDYYESQTLIQMAPVFRKAGEFATAERIYLRALALYSQTFTDEQRDVATLRLNLGALYDSVGRGEDSESEYKKAISLAERFGAEDVLSTILGNLGDLYRRASRANDAVVVLERALGILDRVPSGAAANDRARTLHNLGLALKDAGQLDRAERHAREALEILTKLYPAGHHDMGAVLQGLASIREAQGRWEEALEINGRIIDAELKVVDAEHPDVARAYNNRAGILDELGRSEEALEFYQRAGAIWTKRLPEGHPDRVTIHSNLALHFLPLRRLAEAAEEAKLSTDQIVAAVRTASQLHPPPNNESWTGTVGLLIAARYELIERGAPIEPEMFQAAQWATRTDAAWSLQQMSLRHVAGSPELQRLVRSRQDLLIERDGLDQQLSAALASNAADAIQTAGERSERLLAVHGEIAKIDDALRQGFPQFAALAIPEPVGLAEAKSVLRDNEALLIMIPVRGFPTLPEALHVFVVTKTNTRWVRADKLGLEGLAREVGALRCGLDAAMWSDTKCPDLIGKTFPAVPTPLPFDHDRAYELYKAIFGKIEDLVGGKELLVVAGGPLAQLPLQVLVARRPDPTDDHRSIHWLARDHAITVLPAVSSLTALRTVAKASNADRPMIGFGNPLLDGPNVQHAERARQAGAMNACKQMPSVIALGPVASLTGARGGLAPLVRGGGLADRRQLKAQAPLPETADELCAVANDVGADPSAIYLGARATERTVKALSANGELARYRIVHFATHGTLAGQLDGTVDPGLILTPPEVASEDDDGYLSASEIAGLRLDADWVILSACNTAAAGASGDQALSGLARAFFHAQARALMVSHWEVYSDATVKLITAAVRATSGGANIGRAEALRRAMLTLIEKGEPHEAHPAYWAPFVVVGEGAAAR